MSNSSDFKDKDLLDLFKQAGHDKFKRTREKRKEIYKKTINSFIDQLIDKVEQKEEEVEQKEDESEE